MLQYVQVWHHRLFIRTQVRSGARLSGHSFGCIVWLSSGFSVLECGFCWLSTQDLLQRSLGYRFGTSSSFVRAKAMSQTQFAIQEMGGLGLTGM